MSTRIRESILRDRVQKFLPLSPPYPAPASTDLSERFDQRQKLLLENFAVTDSTTTFHLPSELERGNTRSNRDRLTAWVGTNQDRLRQLMDLYLHGDYRIAQLAAGVVCLVAVEHPDLMTPWLPAIVKRMQEPGIHDAVARTGMTTLQHVNVPRKLAGRVAAICFDSLADISRPIAVRVFAMTVLVNLCEETPALAREVELAITTVLPYGTGAFQSRARREIRRLHRLATASPRISPASSLQSRSRSNDPFVRQPSGTPDR